MERRARRNGRDGRAQGSLEYLLLLFTVIILLIIAIIILRSYILAPFNQQISQLGGILGTSLFDVGAAIPSPTVAAPPVISNVNASPTEANATVTWDTDLSSNSSVEYGVSSGSYLLTASSGTLTTGHSLLLSSLSPNVTYFYRVTSCTGPPDNLCATSSESNFTTLPINISANFDSVDFNFSLSMFNVGSLAGGDAGPALFLSDFVFNSSMAPASSSLVGALASGPGFYYINGYFNATATPAPETPVNVTGP